MKKDTYLMVKVTDEEKDIIRELAESEKRTMSSYVRWLISLAADRKVALKDSSKLN